MTDSTTFLKIQMIIPPSPGVLQLRLYYRPCSVRLGLQWHLQGLVLGFLSSKTRLSCHENSAETPFHATTMAQHYNSDPRSRSPFPLALLPFNIRAPLSSAHWTLQGRRCSLTADSHWVWTSLLPLSSSHWAARLTDVPLNRQYQYGISPLCAAFKVSCQPIRDEWKEEALSCQNYQFRNWRKWTALDKGTE